MKSTVLSALALLTGLFLAALPAGADWKAGASDPLPLARDFDVFRGESTFGFHRVRFEEAGDALIVTTEIELRVRLAFVPVFRYRHEAREVWRDGQLSELESETYDDGRTLTVRARRIAGGLLFVTDAEGRTYELEGEVIPTSYWNARLLEQQRLLNSQDGTVLPITVEPLGTETIEAGGRFVEATKYRVRGTMDLFLWYDPQGRWVKSAFAARGTQVDYVLADPGKARQARAGD